MNTFKFVNDKRQKQLLKRLEKRKKLKYTINNGFITFNGSSSASLINDPKNEEKIWKHIYKIFDRIYTDWVILSFPMSSYVDYMSYVVKHKVDYCELVIDGMPTLLLPKKYRPHKWKIK